MALVTCCASRVFGVGLAVSLSTGNVAAQSTEWCESIKVWSAEAQSAVQQSPATLALPIKAGPAEWCGTSIAPSGARSVHCAWGFAYRDALGQAAFDEIAMLLDQCFPAGRGADKDQIVNHPDSYDLQTYGTEYGTVSVSLKDKGALQKTYVFLRAAPPDN